MATKDEADKIERENDARLAIMELANMISVPMSLHAIINLNIPDIIWQSGVNTPLTPSQILSKLTPDSASSPSPDPQNLQRLLRMLASYDVFVEHLEASSGAGGGERSYSLSDVGKTLVTDEDGLSYAPYVLQHHQDALLRAWPRLHQSVLDPSVEPFARANGGVMAYEYYGEKPEMNELMQKAMSGISVPIMKAVLEGYAGGFDGVERVVDVGGSSGACLKMIMERNPQVKEGINFDLPEVVARAPAAPGVTHVGGDMFKTIPSGDAIFIKWVLTSWNDDACLSILKNCYDALPTGGKVIACEPVLPKKTDSSRRTRALLEGDIFVMNIYQAKCRERTEEEYQQLGRAAGFCNFRAVYPDHFFTILEYRK